ncbi:nitroreductase family deazaflavin-dependent oxidoreductase [Nocardioides sediminis]|uniref:nitroreductase family deazaflavin-dependent oxidoreductase n=1 Tax=Nocardioides sediminis TaxID=433648 RepID=UPI000D30711A|nr:nitroreductase family deazaflavin-dependent oxidoreductase [Nocardioides sediminis]
MGLAADLGYRHRPANAAQRGVQALGSSRAGAWLFSRTLRHLDDAVARVSRGRQSAPQLLAGLPVLDLTTTGRRSGRPRTSHLVSIPVGDDLAVLGTNFGQPATPAWVLNLEADPRATVTYRGRTLSVTARQATDAERDAVVERSRGIYGGYEKYQQRISGRRVRVFVLEGAG